MASAWSDGVGVSEGVGESVGVGVGVASSMEVMAPLLQLLLTRVYLLLLRWSRVRQ